NQDGSDCKGEQTFMLQSIRKGRIVSSTDLYASCIQRAMSGTLELAGDEHLKRVVSDSIGPYESCTGDPAPSDRIGAVVATSRSSVGVKMRWGGSGSGELAHAGITMNPGANEQITYIEPSLVSSLNASDSNLVAALIWHEAMHQHGYQHGNGKAEDCG